MHCFLNSVGLLQLITDATRITPKSSSIIDLIFVSKPDKIQQSGVLPVGFSDHMIIFCTCKLCRLKIGEHKSVKMRSLKNYDKKVFNNSLSSVDWNSIYVSTNVDEAWEKFTHIFLSTLDSVAPLKEIRIKQDSESWYNTDIHELIKKRNCYLISFRKTKSTEDNNKYIDFRNQVSYKIKKTKINFYKERVNNVKSNPKNFGIL